MEPLPGEIVEALCRRESYPGDPSVLDGIELRETHLSYVFLTERFVYKLRKAVRFPFVDFSTRAARALDCRREVLLNRRLAPDVYLGVAPVSMRGGRARVGSARAPEVFSSALPGEEAVTVMRRLPDGLDALSRVRRGELDGDALQSVVDLLVPFHARYGLGAPAPMTPGEWQVCHLQPTEDCLSGLAAEAPAALQARIRRARDRCADFEARFAHRFEGRRLFGSAADCHGDLRLEHVWFEPDRPPSIIDCLEFRDDLRRVDVAADVAFLAMDLRVEGRADLAESFLARYAQAAGDFGLYGVVDYFTAYRALVRARVALLRHRQEPAPERLAEAERYLAVALNRLEAPVRSPVVVLLTGLIGTGKSSVARRLGEELGGVVISSDALRQAHTQTGGAPLEGHDWSRGPFAPSERSRVYGELLNAARWVVESGRVAILDASYSLRERRDEVRSWATALGIEPWIVETCCDPEEVRRRLARRERDPRSTSRAGVRHYDAHRAEYAPPAEWPRPRYRRVDTDDADWDDAIRALAGRLRASLRHRAAVPGRHVPNCGASTHVAR